MKVRQNFTADETRWREGQQHSGCLETTSPQWSAPVTSGRLHGTGCPNYRAGWKNSIWRCPLSKILLFQGPPAVPRRPRRWQQRPPPWTATLAQTSHTLCRQQTPLNALGWSLVPGRGEDESSRGAHPSHPGQQCRLTHQPPVIGVWGHRGLWPVLC